MTVDNPITCEIRCPIHGFIGITAWEKSLVDSPTFQRLRRIRQLAWTDLVYPGAMHNRFEHSLGVMHIATQLFDAICKNSESVLKEVYKYDGYGLARERQKLRLAALLHDVGHSPFSHGSEDLFPFKDSPVSQATQLDLDSVVESPSRFKHEAYSYALIRFVLRSAIEDHPSNRNYRITANEIADLLQGNPQAGASLLWREILDHQLDADRMDYLLRDSHHLGVHYGRYDLPRLISSVCAYENVARDSGSRSVRIGVLSGGLHAAESLVIARYWMFKQVYQHKTRMAFDLHLRGVMKELLKPEASFPTPSPENLSKYTDWDDWKVQGLLAAGHGGDHAGRLAGRGQYRQVYRSEDRLLGVSDSSQKLKAYLQEKDNSNQVIEALRHLNVEVVPSSGTWYKEEAKTITIVSENDQTDVRPLTEVSPIASLNTVDQIFIYADPAVATEARRIADGMSKSFRNHRHRSVVEEAKAADVAVPETIKKDSASVPGLKLVQPGKEEQNAR